MTFSDEVIRLLAKPPALLYDKPKAKVPLTGRELWSLSDQELLLRLMNKGMKTAAIQKAGYFTDKTRASVTAQCSKIRLRGVVDPAMRHRLSPENEKLLVKMRAEKVSYANIALRLGISTCTARKRYLEVLAREPVNNGQ